MISAAFAPLLVALLQTAAQRPSPPPPIPPSDDIVVTGLRDLEDKRSSVTRGTLGSSKAGNATRSRARFTRVETFTACAKKSPFRAVEWLRTALDGNTNSGKQIFAQSRYIELNKTCKSYDGKTGIIVGMYYDRGGLYLQALHSYAPDLKLTKEETADPAVQARFDAREVPRARFRLPVDRTYFEAAVCFVRLQPELSLRLVRQGIDYPSVGRVEAAIVNRARVCVGNARKVYFDPTQFRFYIADAVYRWAVAVRNVDSLIPADG